MMPKMITVFFILITICNAATRHDISNNETAVFDNMDLHKLNYIGPWSEIFENWVITEAESSSKKTGRVMKFGNTTVKVTTSKVTPPNKHDISETDLYLLGAIEKLVYRVNFLEKRLKRTEELLYYVISGNNKSKESCPNNYTRVGQFCYYFSSREYDWKSSASLCRSMGGNLVEFETVDENQDVVSLLQEDKGKNKNYWTGGLNPGLLWIWAASARPVHYDTKQHVIGDGRCLKLEYNSVTRIYFYKGEDCGSRQRYICKLSNDDESANKINLLSRRLLIDYF